MTRSCLDLSLALDQQLHDIEVAFLTGKMQWCPVIPLPCLDIRLVLNQELHDGEVTIPSGAVKQRPTICSFPMNGRAVLLNKSPYNPKIAMKTCTEQRYPTTILQSIYIGTLLDQYVDNVYVICICGCHMQCSLTGLTLYLHGRTVLQKKVNDRTGVELAHSNV